MENWDEIRIAYHVARVGTVSGAAQAVGVHHATVIRYIDALEKRMGTKLFQRHARGYTPTEAGLELLRVASAIDDQFSQLECRIKGQGDTVAGELVVTSLASFSHILTPILVNFQQEHPELSVRYLTGSRLFQLEYGEAHVAIRAGRPPEQPDNVVQKLTNEKIALYGHEDYIAKTGFPDTEQEVLARQFVSYGGQQENAPFSRWLVENVSPEQVKFKVVDERSMQQAILAGAGLGFLEESVADGLSGLIKVLPARPDWNSQIWLVTHVDMHRTAKVQTFMVFLKDQLPCTKNSNNGDD